MDDKACKIYFKPIYNLQTEGSQFAGIPSAGRYGKLMKMRHIDQMAC